MKMVNISELDWFHAMVWSQSLGILECREGVRYNDIRRALNKRFIALRGYLPWHKPELMPDLGPKLNRFCFDLAWDCYEQIVRGEIIFAI